MPEPAAPPATAVLATVADTPIGPLSLLARGGRLIAGGFTADPAEMHARLDRELRTLPLETAGPGDLPWLIKPIDGYFDGNLRALDAIPVHQPGTPSRQRLWAALRAVPPGRTVTYTQLAAQAGCPQAPRAAGGGVCPQPDRPRGPVPPRAADGRQPRRLLLRPGPQDLAAAPRGRPSGVAGRIAGTPAATSRSRNRDV